MKKNDMHDQFLNELNRRFPKRVDLINLVSDILKLEKESVYRRMAGKVNFSVREMGILAGELNISLDNLIHKDEDVQWLPFVLESPSQFHSMDSLCDMIEHNIERIREITRDGPGETGGVHNTLPLGLFVYSPLIMKFMFFKWGHYFVKSDEFNNFSRWELPSRLSAISAGYNDIYNFDNAFYIWDNSMIPGMVKEIDNFFLMSIITREEKESLGHELKGLMSKLERALDGTYRPNVPLNPDTSFYVSFVNVGFTCTYYASQQQYMSMFQTNFSFSRVENSDDTFDRIKEWVKSFRNVSTLLSGSGRIVRRLFFEDQQKIIDQLLQ